MKKRDRETIKNLSDEEIMVKLNELRKKYFQLKFNRISAPLQNPLELRTIRRQIAMIKTFISEKERQKKIISV